MERPIGAFGNTRTGLVPFDERAGESPRPSSGLRGRVEPIPRLDLEQRDELRKPDVLFVLGSLRLAQCPGIRFVRQVIHSGLQLFARSQFGNSTGNLWRQALGDRVQELIDDRVMFCSCHVTIIAKSRRESRTARD